jgi:spore coat polysaccharide biosynthesis protein SpsF (cytidylyltransferase family)
LGRGKAIAKIGIRKSIDFQIQQLGRGKAIAKIGLRKSSSFQF